MWISRKKLNQMIEEAAAKEREREMMYRFMDETHCNMRKVEDDILRVEDQIKELYRIVSTQAPVGKKQLNG